MPCRDEWSHGGGYNDCSSVERRADKNARVACAALRTMSKEQINALPKETRVWWEEHKEADRRREEREAQARQRERDKQAALAKLTPKERKALGL